MNPILKAENLSHVYGVGTPFEKVAIDKGTVIIENGNLTIKELNIDLSTYTGKEEGYLAKSPSVTTVNYEFPQVKTAGHALMLSAFASAIIRGTDLIAGAQDGLNELTLSNAMYLSAWTDSTIKLPMDEDLFYEKLKALQATSKHKVAEGEAIDASSIF